ncbi:MAG: hypothetical protein D6818_00050 [Bacteroidetes bacterium]|nr:MAG: hypothetical protein D6818_00050 [Bacteroidota bacterium]
MSSPYHAICPLGVVPVRAGAHHRSELLSQLLFGELVELVDRKGAQWCKVRCTWDEVTGWVSAEQLQPITPSEFDRYRQHYAICLDLLQPVMSGLRQIPVPIGSRLPAFDGLRFELAGEWWTYSGQAVFPQDLPPRADLLIKIARRYLSAPFLQGGRSPLGLDSGALVQLAFGAIGITLPRQPATQVMEGEAVDFFDEYRPGDIAFFENNKGQLTHAGILLPEGQILHCHDCVRIDRVDHFGIFDPVRKKYVWPLRVIRRVLPPDTTREVPRTRKSQATDPTPPALTLF